MYEEWNKLGYRVRYQPVNLAVRNFRMEYEAKGKQVFVLLSFESSQAF